jgi:hypothetical protein
MSSSHQAQAEDRKPFHVSHRPLYHVSPTSSSIFDESVFLNKQNSGHGHLLRSAAPAAQTTCGLVCLSRAPPHSSLRVLPSHVRLGRTSGAWVSHISSGASCLRWKKKRRLLLLAASITNGPPPSPG